MSKTRDNHRKSLIEKYKRNNPINILEKVINKFHREQIDTYGKTFLRRNIDSYSQLLIKYTTLSSRAFRQPINWGIVSSIIAKLLNELETE